MEAAYNRRKNEKVYIYIYISYLILYYIKERREL